jgi:hypothetical protein
MFSHIVFQTLPGATKVPQIFTRFQVMKKGTGFDFIYEIYRLFLVAVVYQDDREAIGGGGSQTVEITERFLISIVNHSDDQYVRPIHVSAGFYFTG